MEREKIIRAAITLYSRYGYDHVPLRELAFETNIREADILALFPSKETLFEAVLQYIPTILVHYDPSEEDILELLESHTPREVLIRFVTYYDLRQDPLRRSIYRFLFMEQGRSARMAQYVLDVVYTPPARNFSRALDILIEHGAIPPYESGHLVGDMWNRTSLVFEILAGHGEQRDTLREDYLAMTEFYMDLILHGVDLLPFDSVQTGWNTRRIEGAKRLEATAQPAIVRSAFDLFSEQGYSKVKMSQIADRAGLTLSEIYSEYRSKSAIVKDIMEVLLKTNWLNEEDPAFEAVFYAKDSRKLILTLADHYSYDQDESVRQLYRFLFREQYFNEEVKDYLTGSVFADVGKITAQLDAMAAQGRIAPCDSKRIAISFVYCMFSFAVYAALYPDQVVDDVKRNVIVLLISLIRNGTVKELSMVGDDERGKSTGHQTANL